MSYKFKEIWCNKSNFREANRTADDIDYLVIHYQRNNGLSADGIAGKDTFSELCR